MTKDKFKKEMYDYKNINEYYSFYGDIVYISSSVYMNEDYFIILRRAKEITAVAVTKDMVARFKAKTNRDTLIEDLESLESTLHWVVPLGFNSFLNGLISNPNFPDTYELIRLKNNDMVNWNRTFIDDLIKSFKPDHTLIYKNISYNQSSRNGYATSHVTADYLYGSMYTFIFEWVTGNSFFDVKIKHFSSVKTRRIQYFDIKELCILLDTLPSKDDRAILAAVDKFTA